MHITTFISPEKFVKWDKFISNHPHNTIFQSPEMYLFYKKVQNFEPFVFFAINDIGELSGVLLAVLIKEGKGLKGYFSSRVVIYGGPLIAENKQKPVILDLMLDALVEKLKNKSIFIQFRNFFQWNDAEKAVFEKYQFQFKKRLNLIVDTRDKAKTWSGISESRRRQIRKGLKTGAVIKDPANVKEVREFYDLLVDLYRNKVKKPLPDWSFFESFYNFSKEGKLGIIKILKKDDIVIGGILSPVTPYKGIYEWYVAGLDRDYKKQYPSIMVTWASIHYAIEEKLNYFDFMGLGVPEKEYGVREFKLKFGGQIVNYGRFARRNNKQLYHLAEIGYNLIRLIKK